MGEIKQMENSRLIDNMIALIDAGNVEKVMAYHSQHPDIIDVHICKDRVTQLHPICVKAIESKDIAIVDYIFSQACFDPEDDFLIGLSIRTNRIDIVQTVCRCVPTVEYWEYVLLARDLKNPEIIKCIEQSAGKYHCNIANQMSVDLI